MDDLEFENFEGALETEVKSKENEIKRSIVEGLQKLERIQEEKECLSNRKISLDLINKDCFPEMAEILGNNNQRNKQLEIIILSDSEDEYDSWNDTWSSD